MLYNEQKVTFGGMYMSDINIVKVATKGQNLHLRVATGHFASSNRHSNYYIDV